MINRIKVIIFGLLSINFLILIHEFGHFFAAHIFNVRTSVFSIGFGPALAQFSLGNTIFKLAAIPFGGYVSMNAQDIAQQSISSYFIICMAGIVANCILGLAIIGFLGKQQFKYGISEWQEMLSKGNYGLFIGPFSIISLLGQSACLNKIVFLSVLGLLSFNLALFNVLPIPPLDGGEFLLFALQKARL